MNVRFTAWFSERERQAIQQRANMQRTSANVIVRDAVRDYLELDKIKSKQTRPDVTFVTRNQ